jgi:hypothetical protein
MLDLKNVCVANSTPVLLRPHFYGVSNNIQNKEFVLKSVFEITESILSGRVDKK